MLAPWSSLKQVSALEPSAERLRLSTRGVERISQRITQEKKNQALYVSHNWVTVTAGKREVRTEFPEALQPQPDL